MPVVSIIRNKAQLYIKSQLSTRMQIVKMAFEKNIAANNQRHEQKCIIISG